MPKTKKRKITEVQFEEVPSVYLWDDIERFLQRECGAAEVKHFREHMNGQTVAKVHGCHVYTGDLIRFFKYRRQGLTGKKMPLDD